MATKPLRVTWVRDPVFHVRVGVCVGAYARYVATWQRLGWGGGHVGAESGAKTTYVQGEDGSDVLMVWFSPSAARDMGTVAHEAFHAMVMALRARGVEAESVLDETGAYVLEWVFNAVRLALNRRR